MLEGILNVTVAMHWLPSNRLTSGLGPSWCLLCHVTILTRDSTVSSHACFILYK